MKEKLKIILVANNDFDGVGQHVFRINNLLKKKNIDSKILVLHKTKKNPDIILLKRSFFLRIRTFLYNFVKKKFNNLFSFDLATVSFKTINNFIENADVIIFFTLHKIITINNLSKILEKKKIIYFRPLDLELATGGCHTNFLESGTMCNNYKSGCLSCPQLNKLNYFGISSQIFKKKYRLFNNFKSRIFVENKFTKNIYDSSQIFKKNKTNVIYLGVNKTRVKKLKKQVARRELKLGLKNKDIILLFASFNLDAKYKGSEELLRALSLLNGNSYFQEKIKSKKIKIITVGRRNNFVINIPNIKWLHLGLVKSDKTLNLLYRAADVLLCPSINDNGPHIVSEAIQNNLPVIAFNQGIAKETIINNKNGYLIPCYNVEKYAAAINNIIFLKNRLKEDFNTRKIKMKFNPSNEINSILNFIKKDKKNYSIYED